jgi:hypothetical protein
MPMKRRLISAALLLICINFRAITSIANTPVNRHSINLGSVDSVDDS